MSSRLEGERVFCHQCSNEWDRAHGGLTCPECGGEFVEILEPGAQRNHDLSDIEEDSIPDPPVELPSSPQRDRHPLHDHNPWAEDEPRGGFRTYEFTTPHGGRGMFSFSSSTYTSNGRGGFPPPMFGFPPFMQQNNGFAGGFQTRGTMLGRDPRRPPGPGEMQDLFSMIFQTMQNAQMGANQTRQGQDGGPPTPFDLLGAILNPGNGRHGDFIFSQDALERFMEQTQSSNAPPPASEEAIQSLPTKEVTKEMMGNDGTAECSICMDNVELGSDVTFLPCNHWFHGDCVVAWLKEHDTCPHCRKPITKPNEPQGRPQGSRRRSSRRSSYNTNPYSGDGARDEPGRPPDNSSQLREARQQYYGRMEFERPENRRHSSSRSSTGRHHSSRHNSSSGSSGGVTGWIRNRMGI